tara:strand:- start:189532 stop:189813 length:282 start_codon:yes stop_codon:yes gene_type:complete
MCGHDSVEVYGTDPEFLTVLSVKTVKAALASFVFGTGHKHASVGNNRTAVSGGRQPDFPDDVLCLTPFEGDLGLQRDPISAGATKGGPVFGGE